MSILRMLSGLVKDLAEELAMNTNVSVLPLGGDKSAWEVQNLITAFTSRIYGRFVEDWTLTWTLPDLVLEWHHEQVIGSPADLCSIGCSRSLALWPEATAALPTGQRNVYWDRNQSRFRWVSGKSIPDFIKQNLLEETRCDGLSGCGWDDRFRCTNPENLVKAALWAISSGSDGSVT